MAAHQAPPSMGFSRQECWSGVPLPSPMVTAVMTKLDSILKSRDNTLLTKDRLVKAMVFQWPCMDVRVGLLKKLSTEKLMLLNYGVGEDS